MCNGIKFNTIDIVRSYIHSFIYICKKILVVKVLINEWLGMGDRKQ